MKYFDYETYVENETQGYELLTDIGDYDVYVKDSDVKIINHENIVGWQNGNIKERFVNSSDLDTLKQAIENLDNEVEEPIDPADSDSPLTDSEYWQNEIEEILQIR